MIYGYARVSTQGQVDGNSFEEQTETIKKRYSDAHMFYEAESGAETRPVFLGILKKLKKDDVLVVTKLDRFCRKTKDGLEFIERIREKGAIIHILNMGIVEDTPMGNMIITNLLAFAEFERAMIRERTMSGKAIAKAQGKRVNGVEKRDIPNFGEYYHKQKDGLMSVADCCRELGISRSAWYDRATEYECEMLGVKMGEALFELVYEQYKKGEVTARAAMYRLGMSSKAFYTKCNEYSSQVAEIG